MCVLGGRRGSPGHKTKPKIRPSCRIAPPHDALFSSLRVVRQADGYGQSVERSTPGNLTQNDGARPQTKRTGGQGANRNATADTGAKETVRPAARNT